MNLPLKFCVSCGRAISASQSSKMGGLKQIIRAGVTKKLDDSPTSSNFDRARRSYGLEKGLRQLFLTATYIMGTILLYLLAVSYCMKDPEVSRMVNGIFGNPAQAPAKEHEKFEGGGISGEVKEQAAAHSQGASENGHSKKHRAKSK